MKRMLPLLTSLILGCGISGPRTYECLNPVQVETIPHAERFEDRSRPRVRLARWHTYEYINVNGEPILAEHIQTKMLENSQNLEFEHVLLGWLPYDAESHPTSETVCDIPESLTEALREMTANQEHELSVARPLYTTKK